MSLNENLSVSSYRNDRKNGPTTPSTKREVYQCKGLDKNLVLTISFIFGLKIIPRYCRPCWGGLEDIIITLSLKKKQTHYKSLSSISIWKSK